MMEADIFSAPVANVLRHGARNHSRSAWQICLRMKCFIFSAAPEVAEMSFPAELIQVFEPILKVFRVIFVFRMQAYISLHNFMLNVLVCITCAEYASKHGLRGRSEMAEACFAASEGSNESHVYIYIHICVYTFMLNM